jgi:hypothetical protein
MKKITFQDGAVLKIKHDDCSESPRKWDNLSTMVCFHQRYCLGDETDYRESDFHSWDELQSQIEKDHDVALILPLYLFDHSGITISTGCGHFRAQDSMGWDWGQVGFVFVTKDKIRECYGCQRIGKRILERAKKCLLAEVEVYDQYLTGDVWGFVLTTPDGEEDSCWGFYGDDIRENGILDHLPTIYQGQVA